MKKSIFFSSLIFLVVLGTVFFIFNKRNKTIQFIPNQANQPAAREEAKKTAVQNQPLFITGWLPYWSKSGGAASFEENISAFNEIHPFAFEVNSDGSLKDVLKIKSTPWPDLTNQAKNKNVSIIPTILWGDAAAMHNVFSNYNLLSNHVDSIDKMITDNNFSGIDMDYEGKDVADLGLFSSFLGRLHEKLASESKTINCTVEARTEDTPPAGWSGTRAMAWANDYAALNKYCDSVTIMAYDQSFLVYGTKSSFEDNSEVPHAPNADNQWVEEVINYTLHSIGPQKLILGVPTYGWEFTFKKLSTGYSYTRFQSISYDQAMAEAKKAGSTPTRNSGGELSFTYQSAGQNHIVTFSDAEAIRQKMELAKKYNLKGISLFKIDGLADPQLFSTINQELGLYKK